MNKVKIYTAKNVKLGPDIIWQKEMGKNLLTVGIRTWMGDNRFVPNIKIADNGKPYLVNGDLYFNISHSQKYVVCAISEEEVGIDIQFHKKDDVDSLARKTMSAEEWQEYQLAVDKTKYFYDLWAKKESFLKYTGDGLRVDMRLLNIDAYVQEIVVVEGYSCMLCTGSECEYELK